MIPPGKTIGLFGGGPIGRLLGRAAQDLGYRVHLFEPRADSPASAFANKEINAPFEDLVAVKEFARDVDVITTSTEIVPSETLAAVMTTVPLYPSTDVLRLCQSRQLEKAWLRANNFPQTRYAEALEGDIAAAVAMVGRPCIVKTADFSCDGQGQMRIVSDADLERAMAIFRQRRCIVERWLDFKNEICVVVARAASGETRAFPAIETIHARQILDVSIGPARIGVALAKEAEHLAISIAEKLGIVGVLAVEFFLADNGDVFVNEFVPRPHSAGLGTLDGSGTSEFEQHVRAICGLPLGPVDAGTQTVSVNILGDHWQPAEGEPVHVPNFTAILAEPSAKLHLYGTREPRLGRTMGHFTVRMNDLDSALRKARELKDWL
jgi:5-(carboxyamino)imidazole ribonucleotide synthase